MLSGVIPNPPDPVNFGRIGVKYNSRQDVLSALELPSEPYGDNKMMRNANIYKSCKPKLASAIRLSAVISTAILTSTSLQALGQNQASSTQSIMLEEVVVSARKRDESMQDVPVAVSAFSSEQLAALKVRDITNLSVGIPNVSLDDVSVTKGTANFMIRGLGINSAIPSIDPTVGIFVDGVYLGTTNGVITDTFDLERIEVLRGPQGTLFGRNVTGGAVLMQHKKPGEEFEFSSRVATDGNPNGDGGINTLATATVSGPITDTLGAKVTAYYNKDQGWLVNQFNGENDWGNEHKMLRTSLAWKPSDVLEVSVNFEYADIYADGPAIQSHTSALGVPGTPANFSRHSFGYSNDEPGFLNAESQFLTSEINWDVDFGGGVITSVFGWRDYNNTARTDVDAQPVFLLHGGQVFDAEQISEELRYTGRFNDRFNVTTGLYYFSNELILSEQRDLLGVLTPDNSPLLTQSGGGKQESVSYAWFGSVDYDLNDQWVLSAGLNYTYEEKKVGIATLVLNVNSPCKIANNTCPIDFRDKEDWSNWSPKLGATYSLSDDEILYGDWSVGYRSGGYNLRNTALDTVNFGPGPTDEEKVMNYEAGYKGTLMGGKARINAAVFFTQVDDMQREINLADANSGIVQVVRNSADAELWGVEFDGRVGLTESLYLFGAVGYTHSEYVAVKFDLNGDGAVDGKDKNLDLPRAAEWTYSFGLNLDTDLGDNGYLASRISYAYRDGSPFTDNNLGVLNPLKILDAGIDYHTAGGQWTFSIYGRNLLNDVGQASDTQLPPMLGPVPLGGTFSPLMTGRKVGVEITFNL